MFERLWVWMMALYTGWTWHLCTLISCKNWIVCFKRPKVIEKEAENGPFKNIGQGSDLFRVRSRGFWWWHCQALLYHRRGRTIFSKVFRRLQSLNNSTLFLCWKLSKEVFNKKVLHEEVTAVALCTSRRKASGVCVGGCRCVCVALKPFTYSRHSCHSCHSRPFKIDENGNSQK